MKKKLFLFALSCVLPGVASAQYHIEALTYPGSDNVTPTSIANGFISGNAITDSGLKAALWTPGGLQTLAPPAGSTLLGISAVNSLGDAVGTAGGGRTPPQGLVWHNGVATYLPNEDGDADETEYLYGSRAVGINALGTIIGTAETQYGDQGVVWSGGQIQLLMGFDPIDQYQHSVARSINVLNQVVGSADRSGAAHAAIWENGVIREIGGLGDRSAAADINDGGTTVGWTLNADGSTSGFVNDISGTSLLPTLAGYFYGDASAINDAGTVVGYFAPQGTEEGVAAIWKNGQAYDLNSLLGPDAAGWNLISAVDIDNDGTIVGFGRYNGDYAAFALRPVPEPASMIALACGIAALARRARRKS